jgi:hypothetical protein
LLSNEPNTADSNLFSITGIIKGMITILCCLYELGCILALSTSFAFMQGWSSHIQCIKRISRGRQNDQSIVQAYHKNREQIKVLLPLLPIRIHERTIDRALSMLPRIFVYIQTRFTVIDVSRGVTIYSHIYPRQRYVSLMHKLNLNIIGLLIWLQHRNYENNTSGLQ